MATRSDEAQPLLDALETRGILTFLAGAVLGLTARTLLAALTGGPSPAAKKRSASATVARRPKPQLPAPREELKMVLCVNQSLGMGKGKIGAHKVARHVSHTAAGVDWSKDHACAPPLPAPLSAVPRATQHVSAHHATTAHLAGAQCAHAAVGVLQKHFNSATEVAFRQWERFGQPKITLKIPDETAMV
jgi:peptidyl-tRNA hydrolase